MSRDNNSFMLSSPYCLFYPGSLEIVIIVSQMLPLYQFYDVIYLRSRAATCHPTGERPTPYP